jgi:hypothetical protein
VCWIVVLTSEGVDRQVTTCTMWTASPFRHRFCIAHVSAAADSGVNDTATTTCRAGCSPTCGTFVGACVPDAHAPGMCWVQL